MNSRLDSDELILSRCRVEVFRGPGPGGQKRNKTSSNVRLTHGPTGISVIAGESRSQAQNKAMALRRLRLRMAIELRQPAEMTSPPPEWFRLDVSPKNELYPGVVGLVLDVLATTEWAMQPAREYLGVGSSQLLRFLKDEPDVWSALNQARARHGLHPLS